MNWVTVAVVGAVAAWFEYSYRRSRRKKDEGGGNASSTVPVSQSARVEMPGSEPSIVPGDENDKQMNAAI
jgi:hypothetical protein